MKKRTLSVVIYAAIAVVSLLFLIGGSRLFSGGGFPGIDLYRAKVLSVDHISFEYVTYSEQTVVNETVRFTAEVRSGGYRGEVVEATQYVDNLYPNTPSAVTAGERILLQRTSISADGEEVYLFHQHDRTATLALLCFIFLAMIVLLARKQSLPIILSLAITCLAVFMVYIPAILYGANIYALTVVTALFIIATSLFLIGGVNLKSVAAIIGNAGGVVIAGLLALLFNQLLQITGMLGEDYLYLLFLFEDKPLDLRAVVFSGIVIGALGAVMDVAMSMASSINELADNMADNSFRNLMKSGMNIGRDVIGTMTNTLVLAYIGSSLATVLLLTAYNRNLLYILNLEMIVVSAMQALIGSIGILAAVPVTAAVSATMFQNRRPPEPSSKADAPAHVPDDSKPDAGEFAIGHSADDA